MQDIAPYKLQAFYDGGCPLCSREIDMLRRWDREQSILFTDINAPDFSADAYGKPQAELMDHMHARMPDGSWVTGVEVFRQLYSIVGFGMPVRFSRLPVVSQGLGVMYAIFAKLRPYLPRRKCVDDRCELR
jgi:predicted DCC family thiol-disulfide oxidoreductase YuxK